MWRIANNLFDRFLSSLYSRRINHALALHLRGEVRPDGLERKSSYIRLDISWRARNIHPWDQNLMGPHERENAFVEQALADAEASIERLFRALPVVDVLDITVFSFSSDEIIIAGTINRSAMSRAKTIRSVRMRLQEMGASYYFKPSGDPDEHCYPGYPGNLSLLQTSLRSRIKFPGA